MTTKNANLRRAVPAVTRLTAAAASRTVSTMTHEAGGNMRPTNNLRIVVVFAVTLAVLEYIDRVAISQAAPMVMKDLAVTKEQMSWVFSAFTLAYALFEIPGGYLGDWIGPRKVRDRSANGTSASVGRAGRITRSIIQDRSGWMRRSLRGAEGLPIHARGRVFLVGSSPS